MNGGKLLGIGVTAVVLHKCGFEFPKGMKIKHVIMVALIAGCGLTVSLFVAGEAFANEDVQGQAKLGSLFSLAAAAFGIGLSYIFDFTDVADIDEEDDKLEAASANSSNESEEDDEQDEYWEHTLAVNQCAQIKQIRAQVKQAEKDHDISRAEMIKKYRQLKGNSPKHTPIPSPVPTPSTSRAATPPFGSSAAAGAGHIDVQTPTQLSRLASAPSVRYFHTNSQEEGSTMAPQAQARHQFSGVQQPDPAKTHQSDNYILCTSPAQAAPVGMQFPVIEGSQLINSTDL